VLHLQSEVAKKVAIFDEVQDVMIINGEWDPILKVKVPDMKDLDNSLLTNFVQ